jgi:amylosucrase
LYHASLHRQVNALVQQANLDIAGADNLFYTRFIANAPVIHALFQELYSQHPQAKAAFDQLLHLLLRAYLERPPILRQTDEAKAKSDFWFLSNDITGMSLYVDRFCGKLETLSGKLDYFQNLGVNLLHLMPLFESPAGESDGGYAVSDFRKVDGRFGKLADLRALRQKMGETGMYLMIDIVLNHTSNRHAWAEKARKGDKYYQDYYYFFEDREVPDQFDRAMPDIFPESAPGNFTYVPECQRWAMTVFHQYQWDLNYTNPRVLAEMLDTIFFYANIGVDILRIDAPAFIWKQAGTTCQNLPQAHRILRLIKQCVAVSAPGMALLGEAIVAPEEIMKYFGTGPYEARECDFAYNATQMALQWDALATGDTRVMLHEQPGIARKPFGTSWITYTRCHDDIGLGYSDSAIRQAGFNPYAHRKFLKDYYSGQEQNSPARGALFSVNPKTQDARISGSLAALCGLEKALEAKDDAAVDLAIRKILLMQAHSFFLGGIPMLFYGDELGYTNDYSYLDDPGKSYDNRWMHRPVFDWRKNRKSGTPGTVEARVFSATRRLIQIRRQLPVVADQNNTAWLYPHNIHVAGFLRSGDGRQLFCLFNYSGTAAYLTWYAIRALGPSSDRLFDHWSGLYHTLGADHEFLILAPYAFCLLEPQ